MFVRTVLIALILASSAQNGRRDPNVPEAIPIVVSPDGFLQNTIALPAGAYAFVVLNRTGLHDVTVYLERVVGNSVASAAAHQEFGENIGGGKTRLVKQAKLTPGTYRLRVENRPDWVCAIQVK